MRRTSSLVGTLLLATILLSYSDAMAQQRRRQAPARRVNTNRSTSSNLSTNASTQEPKVESVPTPPAPADSLPLKATLQSRRKNTTVEGDLIVDKVPLAYDNLRKDDQVYRQVIWREIDTREKINLPFRYEAEEENGSQRFFDILLKSLKDGDLTAFSSVNDRFTTPMTTGEIGNLLSGSAYTISKPDYVKDPDGSKGIMKDTTIRDEFNVNTITTYRIKEEVVFDRETSRLHFRILGLAPVKSVFNDDGSFRDSYPLFWLYYPDMRPILAKYEAYNPRNYGARLSWEELFETRYFSSYIVKSTLNNPFDRPLAGYIPDPLMRLLEGENIKEQIFNWEQDQWSY